MNTLLNFTNVKISLWLSQFMWHHFFRLHIHIINCHLSPIIDRSIMNSTIQFIKWVNSFELLIEASKLWLQQSVVLVLACYASAIMKQLQPPAAYPLDSGRSILIKFKDTLNRYFKLKIIQVSWGIICFTSFKTISGLKYSYLFLLPRRL